MLAPVRCSYNLSVPDSPKSIIVYCWRIFDQRKKRWRELSWMMDDETAGRWAKSEGAQIEKVEGSAQERRDVSGKPGPQGRM